MRRPIGVELRRLALLVGREVALLNHYRDIFEAFRMRILVAPEQHALRFGHFFFNAMYEWYTTSQFVSLRALTDTNAKKQMNLGTLLKEIDRADPSELGVAPASGAVSALIGELKVARAELHRYVSMRIAHRDSEVVEGPNYVDANALLVRVDAMMGNAWEWVFGIGRPRIFVERDDFWIELLFGQRWLPPTEYSPRLSAGRESRFVTDELRHDFTPTDVWGSRPTDEFLSEIGMTREQFERFRSGNGPSR